MKIYQTIIFCCCLTASSISATATTFTVTNTNDAGAGSLRDAITQSEANGIPDLIEFNIPGAGNHIITLASNLPELMEANTVIDATTQPGWTLGNVVLDGNNAFKGLFFRGTDCQVIGMHIQNCDGDPIRFWFEADNFMIDQCLVNNNNTDGIYIEQSDGGTITNCYIGTDASGNVDLSGGASYGITVAISNNILIQNNVIGGFTVGIGTGIRFLASNSNTISGNFIGVNAAGTTTIPNNIGIELDQSSSNNQITNNVIGGNILQGIKLIDNPSPG